MRRTGALALLMLLAACGGGDPDSNQSEAGNGAGALAAGDRHEVAATVTLAGSGPGGCSARWNDQPATPEQMLERSAAAVEQAIERAGGVSNLTEATMPALAVVAPAGLTFACVDTYLAPIRRAGVQTLLLSVEGAGDAALAEFALSDIGAPPATVVLAIGAGGRLTWNNEAIASNTISERLSQMGGGPSAGVEALAGELELRPAREASFGQVHGVLRAVRSGRFQATLLLPSVTPTRLPAPPAAPPPGNQTAPRP